ncbi:hypothetical protein GCM10009867_32400 [Pedococcus aerophilus]|uniref:Uncharacterized protein n=1 Tax=Pedococcus aerophilus TaxID=436356 RepID=A0ABN3UVS5_9MICO
MFTQVSGVRYSFEPRASAEQGSAGLEGMYESTPDQGITFTTNVDTIIRKGLDPQVVARLLAEGPRWRTRAGGTAVGELSESHLDDERRGGSAEGSHSLSGASSTTHGDGR